MARATGVLTVWIVDAGETKTEPKLEGLEQPELKKFVETVQINGADQLNGRIGIRHGKIATWAVSASEALRESLQVRLGVLIGIMWLANVVGPSLYFRFISNHR